MEWKYAVRFRRWQQANGRAGATGQRSRNNPKSDWVVSGPGKAKASLARWYTGFLGINPRISGTAVGFGMRFKSEFGEGGICRTTCLRGYILAFEKKVTLRGKIFEYGVEEWRS